MLTTPNDSKSQKECRTGSCVDGLASILESATLLPLTVIQRGPNQAQQSIDLSIEKYQHLAGLDLADSHRGENEPWIS